MPRAIPVIFFAALAAIHALAGWAEGATIRWDQPTSGNWGDAARWSPAVVPGPGDEVVLDEAGGYVVTLDVDAEALSIRLGGPGCAIELVVVDHLITTSAGIQVLAGSHLRLERGEVWGPGPVTLFGHLTCTSGALWAPLDHRGVVVVDGPGATFGEPITTSAPCTTRVIGMPERGGASLLVAQGFANHGRIELASSGGPASATLILIEGTLRNQAGAEISVLAGDGGARQLTCELDNVGSLRLETALDFGRAFARHQSAGAIEVLGGDLTVTQFGIGASFTSSGTLTVAAGRTLRVIGGAFDIPSGAFGGSGALELTNVPSASVGMPFLLAALSCTDAALSFVGDLANDVIALSLTRATLRGSGRLVVAAPMTLRACTIECAIEIRSLLDARGASAFAGPVSTTAGSGLRIASEAVAESGPATLTVSSGFSNLGMLELVTLSGTATTALRVLGGTVVNQPGATLRLSAGSGGTRWLDLELDNRGTIPVEAPTSLGHGGASHRNAGRIELALADLEVVQAGGGRFANRGDLVVASSRTFTVTGGVLALEQGTVTGLGTLRLRGSATLRLEQVPAIRGLTAQNATIDLATDLNLIPLNTSFTLTRFTGTGTLLTDGLFEGCTFECALSPGGMTLLGGNTIRRSFTTGTDGGIQLEPRPGIGPSFTTADSGFTLNNQLGLRGREGTNYGSGIDILSGSLVVGSTGWIVGDGFGGGTRRLGAQLENGGVVLSANGANLVVNRASSRHLNLGNFWIVAGSSVTVQQSGTGPSFTNEGGLFLEPGGTLAFSGGTVRNGTTGAIRGNGIVSMPGSTLIQEGLLDPAPGVVYTFTPQPGPGTLTVRGAIRFEPTSRLQIEIGGLSPGSQHDRLALTEDARLHGTLALSSLGSFVPHVGDSITVLSAQAVTGTFGAVTGTDFPQSQVRWRPEYRSDRVVLVAEAIPGGPPPGRPLAADDAASVAEDDTVGVEPLANDTDPEGDPLRIVQAWSPAGAHGAVRVASFDSLAYAPFSGYFGSDRFLYVVEDPVGLRDTATVFVTVAPVPDPIAWMPDGLPITDRLVGDPNVRVVPDDGGGCYVAWDNGSSVLGRVLLQHLLENGAVAPGWPAAGLAIYGSGTVSYRLTNLARDGSGGAFVLGRQESAGAFEPYYLTRVLRDGMAAPGWELSGQAYDHDFDSEAFHAEVVPDDLGGSCLVWSQSVSGAPGQVWGTRVDAAGFPFAGWGFPQRLAPTDFAQSGPRVMRDGAGGTFVAWTDHRTSATYGADAYFQRFTAYGSVAPGWPARGLRIGGMSGDQFVASLVPDSEGGAFAVLVDGANGAVGLPTPNDYQRIHALRIRSDATAHPAWPPGGRWICDATGAQYDAVAIGDGAGGLLVAWSDRRTGGDRPRLVRLDASGIPRAGWAGCGREVTTGPGGHSVSLAPDGTGGAYVAFLEDAAGTRLVVQHVLGSGALAPGWPAEGRLTGLTSGSLAATRLAASDVGGAFVAWLAPRDQPGGSEARVSRIEELGGPTAVAVSVATIEAAPDRVRLAWQLGPDVSPGVGIERRAESAGWSAVAHRTADRGGHVAFDDLDVRGPIRLGYRLRISIGDEERVGPEAWVDVPAAIAEARFEPFPNPSLGSLAVRFSLPMAEAGASLRLFDVAGREVARADLGGLGTGTHVVDLAARGALESGIYWVKLRHGAVARQRRIAFVR